MLLFEFVILFRWVDFKRIFAVGMMVCLFIQYVWTVSYTVLFPQYRSENDVGVNYEKENLPEWLGKMLDSAVGGLAVFDGVQ